MVASQGKRTAGLPETRTPVHPDSNFDLGSCYCAPCDSCANSQHSLSQGSWRRSCLVPDWYRILGSNVLGMVAMTFLSYCHCPRHTIRCFPVDRRPWRSSPSALLGIPFLGLKFGSHSHLNKRIVVWGWTVGGMRSRLIISKPESTKIVKLAKSIEQ